jgi:hypothetical protein
VIDFLPVIGPCTEQQLDFERLIRSADGGLDGGVRRFGRGCGGGEQDQYRQHRGSLVEGLFR